MCNTRRVPLVIGFILASVLLGGLVAAEERTSSGLPVVENGDVNGDDVRNVSDAVYLLRYLFTGGPAPVPIAGGRELAPGENGDVNGDGTVDPRDAIYLLTSLFTGGPAPVRVLGMGGEFTLTRPVFYETSGGT